MIYAGTSGYSFREWVGAFYPPKTPSSGFLSYYASQLSSVEINHTFRRFPKIDLTASWADAVPETFRFSLKMHQSVTHMARLKNVGGSVRDFTDALMPLGPRLGIVLFQLPPFFRLDLGRLEGFLKELPRGLRYAMEFRHESWGDPGVEARLRDAGVALCHAELEIGETKGLVTTAPFAYVRLRKTPPYSEEEIGRAAKIMKELAGKVEDVYLYVKHDEEGRAPAQVREIQSRATGST